MQWVLEISDKPGESEAEPAFKVNELHQECNCSRVLALHKHLRSDSLSSM